MKLLSLAPLSFVAFTAVSAIDRIIAYGDSFTDNGNVYRHSSFPPSPPNYKGDRKSTRLNSSHSGESRMPSSA